MNKIIGTKCATATIDMTEKVDRMIHGRTLGKDECIEFYDSDDIRAQERSIFLRARLAGVVKHEEKNNRQVIIDALQKAERKNQ